MPTYASTTVTPPTDGVPYCTAATMPVANADTDLGTPFPMVYGEAVVANVIMAVNGSPASNTTFVVLQTDLGDNNWFDAAWLKDTATSGAPAYLLSGGVAGANAVGQTRVAGTAPSGNGSNQIPLGARCRFVGRSQLSGGTNPTVTVTVRYKLLGFR